MKTKHKILILLGVGLPMVAMIALADCTTDVPATCHFADTNLETAPGYGAYPLRVTSDGFSTKCVTTTNTAGGDQCNSVTNNCVYQEWHQNGIGLGGKVGLHSVTNTYDTTGSAGDCGA